MEDVILGQYIGDPDSSKNECRRDYFDDPGVPKYKFRDASGSMFDEETHHDNPHNSSALDELVIRVQLNQTIYLELET
ncbi:unnamed protein product [Rotaria sp. Silwood2]|nr:unnamed protein product [Rotaria sp. Silwood2]CAF4084015.1 unnamed protein product [Rotaria sp. Silwood2]